jgi:hypothetical protein
VTAFDAAGNVSGTATTNGTTLDRQDKRAPKPPRKLQLELTKPRTVVLSWKASTDDVGVEGYRVFRNDKRIATVSRLRFKDRLPHARMAPTYHVVAFDAAGNVSAPSRTAAIRR